jgi:hypothetical protein
MPKRKPDDMVGLQLRFTEALRARIEQEAKKNHRSLNSEIVYRLGTTFGAEGVALAAEFDAQEKEVQRELGEMLREYIKNVARATPPVTRRRG